MTKTLEDLLTEQDERLSKLSVHESISRLMRIITEHIITQLPDDDDEGRRKAALFIAEMGYILGRLDATISNNQNQISDLIKRMEILERFNKDRWYGDIGKIQ